MDTAHTIALGILAACPLLIAGIVAWVWRRP